MTFHSRPFFVLLHQWTLDSPSFSYCVDDITKSGNGLVVSKRVALIASEWPIPLAVPFGGFPIDGRSR